MKKRKFQKNVKVLLNKKKFKKRNIILLIGIAFVVISIIYFCFIVAEHNRKIYVYSQFTCTCCKGSILETSDSCFMAGGMKRYIDKLSNENKSKEGLMIESVKKFGLSNLINQSLKQKYWFMFINETPQNTPNISISPSKIDLGVVSNSKGIIISDFKIKNKGREDLIIYDLTTSCSCLTASFIRDGKETVRTGRFSHSEGWTFILKPREEGMLRTYYDPRVTNWQTGHVERIVSVTSNDPIYYNKVIKITAELVP